MEKWNLLSSTQQRRAASADDDVTASVTLRRPIGDLAHFNAVNAHQTQLVE